MKTFLGALLAGLLTVGGLPGLGLADTMVYTANLDGASESPPVPSPGTGFARVTVDTLAHTLRVEAEFSGLVGNTTTAHIHGPTASPGTGNAGVMTRTPTFPGFPAGVTSGAYDGTFDMTMDSTWNPAFLTASGGETEFAEADFLETLAAGKAYFNIHTSFAGAGEIRGFLAAPAPASLLLLGTGLAGLAGVRLRARQRGE